MKPNSGVLLVVPLLLLLLLAVTGCGSCSDPEGSGSVCVDEDGDGYGSDCAAGPDCDDSDARRNTSCDCTRPGPGCPCIAGTSVPCYEGPLGTEGVGICRPGTTTCDSDGRFALCVGQTTPQSAETCNHQDDDCDGDVDEGVLSACGNCNPACGASGAGPGSGRPFPTPGAGNSTGVVLDGDGNLILDTETAETQYHFLFVANADEGTVSKIDTKTMKEVGRYTSALSNVGVASQIHASPSRTAIDVFGDCWVANRANVTDRNDQGSVTKIATNGCVDRNGDSVITTSADLDGDGRISTSPAFVDPAGLGRREYYGDADECVLFTVSVGQRGGIPRALAVTGSSEDYPAGRVFVGAFSERRVHVLDGRDGSLAPLGQNPIDIDLEPYGAALDSQGNVWLTTLESPVVQAVRSVGGALAKSSVFRHSNAEVGSYGIATDHRDRVWIGGFRRTYLSRFAPTQTGPSGLPTSGTWQSVDVGVGTSCASSHTRGVTAHADQDGNTWIWTGFTDGCIGVVNADSMAVREVLSPPGGYSFIGVGGDFLVDPRTGSTHMWAVSRAATGPQGEGAAVRVTYDYRAAAGSSAVAYDHVLAGAGPYTYSDFTSYGLRNYGTRSGSYALVLPGCASGETRWERLLWDVYLPKDTQACVRVVALDRDDLDAPGLAVTQPVCLTNSGGLATTDLSSLPPAPFARVELTLTRLSSSSGPSPSVSRLEAQFTCPTTIPEL